MVVDSLTRTDPRLADAIRREALRQNETLELIASENFVSEAVLEATGSVFTNKYAEGYPGRRYYGGCEFADVVETLARDRAKALFGAEHANVQPHSGSQANMAAYLTVLKPGDKILGMNLAHGGHLTHGHPLSFSGKLFEVCSYGVDPETEQIDYDELERIAHKERPRMIVAGASAYSRIIHFDRIGEIAREVGAFLMTDVAHIAGLIVAGLHPSPVPCADFVTSTTHKTLRGPRGGLVLCGEAHAKGLDKTVFPGIQGGPLVHVIAAKAAAFQEAGTPQFKDYQGQILRNAKRLSQALADAGFRIVSGGTDNHLFMVDVFSRGITGKAAEVGLENAGIAVNKNTIPFDRNPPLVGSGIRIGTPAVTTRGMAEDEMDEIASLIVQVLSDVENPAVQADVKRQVVRLAQRFPSFRTAQSAQETRVG